MKKFLLSLAALAMSLGALAQSNVILPSQITFNPADEEMGFVQLPNVNQNIQVTMDVVPSVPVTIMYVTGNGFGMEMRDTIMNVTTPTFNIPLEESDWGLPFFETYYLNLAVTFTHEVDGEIEYYLNEDGEPVVFSSMYITSDIGPARWAKNYPTERNFTEEGLTFAEFYNMGVCTFYFTKDVTLPSGSIGTIVYTTDSTTTRSRITDYTAEWDEDLGLYAVSVDVRNEDYTAADLDGIKVTLSGVKDGNDQVITVPALEVDNNDVVPQRAPKKRGIETGLISDVETLNIYNVQGMLVKENVSASAVNELPAGLYIVNGKKVVVR